MNMFQFAIASIVDANTGNGLVHTGGRPDYGSLEKRGRRIRSQSVLDLAQAIRIGIADFLDGRRARAQERRDLNRLLSLNDHLLEDIGLQRNDLYLVQSGVIELKDLTRGSRSRHDQDWSRVKPTAHTEILDAAPDATNQQFYEQRKCA